MVLATDILRQASELGITLSVTKDRIQYQPKSAASHEFVQALRQNKPAVMRHLIEAEDLDGRIQREGYVLCWASTLNDFVAFHRDDLDTNVIPPEFVRYPQSEVRILFDADKPDISLPALLLIHEAKKLGMKVKSNEPGDSSDRQL